MVSGKSGKWPFDRPENIRASSRWPSEAELNPAGGNSK
jgi:hypothetical protein